MPFDEATRADVEAYVEKHLGDRSQFRQYFDFIDDGPLVERLTDEFYTARYTYKILEGLAVSGELRVSQVRQQVLQYASIYEAVIHHLLFAVLSDRPEVIALTNYKTLRRYDIPQAKRDALATTVEHDGREIVAAYWSNANAPKSTVRFESKIDCALELGLLDQYIAGQLKRLYEARNSIHLHAELARKPEWSMEIGANAFKMRRRFKDQIWAGLKRLGREPEVD